MENSKNICEAFLNEYKDIAEKYGEVKFEYDNCIYSFSKIGFVMNELGIEYTFSEMNDIDRSICARLTPDFRIEYKKLIGV